MSDQITPFNLHVPDADLERLQRKLADTRWPEAEPVDDWSQGAKLAGVQALVEHWRIAYDWRRCERMLNGFGQYKTEIDGLEIHFLHIRSPHPNALPILMTHGWPGSVIEFHKVIEPLTDPTRFGGKAADAFDLVIPSLPGYGFSQKPSSTGWNLQRIAKAWAELMSRLGYSRWVAQGGDWGSMVTTAIGALAPPGLAGIHINMVTTPFPKDVITDPTPQEQKAIADMQRYHDQDSAYARQQGTRPQTLAYGLTDSPVGQAAWIYEKYREWSDCDGSPETVFTRDEMLDNIMLYWLPATGGSSGRLYWEAFRAFNAPDITVPTGVSIFPHEIFRTSRRWAETKLKNIVYWNELERGGHFAAFERPELFVNEIRAAFSTLR
jgi:pimeloyl-ACP methyl ester carboxylesterase